MDAVRELAKPDRNGTTPRMDDTSVPAEATSSTAEIRDEIDSTRSNLAEKLEALEGRAMDTVQSAQETVEDSIQMAKDTVATVKRTFDIKYQFSRHPWSMVGGCFLAGLAVGSLFPRFGPRSAPKQERQAGYAPPASTEHWGNHNLGVAAAATPPVSKPGFFDKFHEEIDKIKGIAIGSVMGRVRDLIKDSVPQLASQIEGVMDSITTKMGGSVAQSAAKEEERL